jgi:hypothetical protein
MAKQQSQTFQALLIVFVLLTALFGVVAIAFWFRSDQLSTERDEMQQQLTQESGAARAAEQDLQTLRGLAGFAPDASAQVVQDQFAKDALLYGAGLDETQRNYREFSRQLYQALQEKTAQVLKYQETEQQMVADVQAARQEAQTAKQTAEQTIAQLRQELLSTRQGLESQRQKDEQQKQSLITQNEQLTSQLEQLRASTDKTISDLQFELKTAQNQLALAKNRLDAAEPSAFQQPDGAVTRVNRRAGIVWINLGRQDGLRPNITFQVYDAGANGLGSATPKATLEVVQIHNGHTAEARIVQDDHRNPIVSGDLIASPVWNPGSTLHFALAGKMDINDDGVDDRQTVRVLIQRTGGIVDAETDDQGDVQGKLTVQTRYLVLGDQPTESTDATRRQGYSDLIDQANRLGVEQISVDELIDSMGLGTRVRNIAGPELLQQQRQGQSQVQGINESSRRGPTRRELW